MKLPATASCVVETGYSHGKTGRRARKESKLNCVLPYEVRYVA